MFELSDKVVCRLLLLFDERALFSDVVATCTCVTSSSSSISSRVLWRAWFAVLKRYCVQYTTHWFSAADLHVMNERE
jgi:hypothetical protein